MAAAGVASPAAKLLDFSQPLDVPLLDATVTAFYGAASPEEVQCSLLRLTHETCEADNRVPSMCTLFSLELPTSDCANKAYESLTGATDGLAASFHTWHTFCVSMLLRMVYAAPQKCRKHLSYSLSMRALVSTLLQVLHSEEACSVESLALRRARGQSSCANGVAALTCLWHLCRGRQRKTS